MKTQACPHCRASALAWFGSLPEWIAAADAHGAAYDSQLAHEMLTSSPSGYWLCHNCSEGGVAIREGSEPAQWGGGNGPSVVVTAPLTIRGANHLVAGHTADFARKNCADYHNAVSLVSPTIVAMREESGQDKGGGDDDVFGALAAQATDYWRDTARLALSQASIADLPPVLRFVVCFTHAFADVVWDELGESVDDACGSDEQARLDKLVALWMELNGPKANKPVSRKAKQKAEAKIRADANRNLRRAKF